MGLEEPVPLSLVEGGGRHDSSAWLMLSEHYHALCGGQAGSSFIHLSAETVFHSTLHDKAPF